MTVVTQGEAGNSDKRIGRPNDLTSLVFAIPNQGQLIAYEKMVIFFQFSPRCVLLPSFLPHLHLARVIIMSFRQFARFEEFFNLQVIAF